MRSLARQPSRRLDLVIRWSIAFLLLWLLVGPRIELDGAHGLRVEDFVFALLGVLCVIGGALRRRPSSISLALFGVVAASLLSACVAVARGMVDPVPAVLFSLRPLEYWIAFPAAVLLLSSPQLAWRRRVERLLVVVTVLQTGFAVVQYYFDLPIGFSHVSYDRAAGLTVGPYELGAISAALVVYWVARGRFTMASLAVIALATSISRISILGAGVALLVFATAWAVSRIRVIRVRGWRAAFPAWGRSRWRSAGQVASVVAAAAILALTIGVVHLPQQPRTTTPSTGPVSGAAEAPEQPSANPDPSTTTAISSDDDGGRVEQAPGSTPSDAPAGPTGSIAQRFQTTSVVGSWDVARGLAAVVPRVRTSAEYQDVAYARLWDFVQLDNPDAAGTEASNLVRFFRWHLILDNIDTPTDVMFGLGPSFVGVSVDGSYLRFFADGGILGVIAWAALILTWFRRMPLWMRCVSVSFLVGAVFIDIVYAQRPMVLLWLLLAVAVTERARRVTLSRTVDAID